MVQKKTSEYKDELQGKCIAYSRVFSAENVFLEEVMRDLAKFCRADSTTFHADPRIHAALEGRREVFLRIQMFLNLSPDEIMDRTKIKEFQGE